MLTNLSTTDILAGWGAITGTAGLAWKIWEWQQDRAKVDVVAKFHGDGGEPWISYKIRNRGSQPTTIEEVQLITTFGGLGRTFGFAQRTLHLPALFPDAIDVPAPLAPGGYWEGTSPATHRNDPFDEDVVAMVKARRLYCRVRLTHTSRRVRALVRPEGILDLL